MSRSIALSLLSLSLAISSPLGAQDRPSAEPKPAQAAGPATAPVAPVTTPVAPAPQPGVAPAAPPKEEVVPPEQVIARIGDQTVREKDFEDALRALVGKRFEQMSSAPGGLGRLRQQFIDNEVLAAKARKDGLQRLPEFKQELKLQEDLILVKLLMSEDRDGSEGQRLKQKAENPSEEEVKAFFDKNPKRYDIPERFTARHILVAVKGGSRTGDKGLSDEDAKAKIAKIQAELAGGKPFADAVKEYSDDPGSKNTGGLIKDAAFGGFVKEFEEAVRRQELGRVGDPVKTVFGYHLILVESRTAAQPAVYDQVREKVKQQMIPERRQAAYTEFVEQVRKEMGVVLPPTSAPTAAGAAATPAPAAPPAAAKPAGAAKPAAAAKP